nr:Vitamin B12-dependent ribonucleoside-diphosphate reductase [uncultured bacterium]
MPKLQSTIHVVMRMLDNVIDINYYPTEAAKRANVRHRPVGLGMMGMQDALYLRRIPFDSQEAVKFNDEIVEAIAYYAYAASSNLADERGSYSSFAGSKWDRGLMPLDTLEQLEKERGVILQVGRDSRLDWDALRDKIKVQGMRNSNCLAIAPTATISNIMGCTPCIEPSYKHIHTKSNLSGEFVRTNDYLVKELMDLGIWDEEMLSDLKYFDGSIQAIERIPDGVRLVTKPHLRLSRPGCCNAAAARQKWLDQSQSVNLFLAETTRERRHLCTVKLGKRGLKTTYYLRTINKSSIDSANRERKRSEPASACSLEAMRNGTICESCQ